MHLAGLSRACLGVSLDPPILQCFFLDGLRWRPLGWPRFCLPPCYDGTDFAPCQFNGCMHQVTIEMVLLELDRLPESSAFGMCRALGGLLCPCKHPD